MSTGDVKHVCSVCGEPSSLQCPTCLQLKMPSTHFCGKECFKQAWPKHNKSHKARKKILEYKPPIFAYTGDLRPHYVSQMRSVPSDIEKPDYWASGQSPSEQKEKRDNKIHVNTPTEIKGIRAACAIGREILDIAGNMVAVGVTTEQIDEVVHNETIKRGAYPSPLNYYHFPKSCCTSVNEVICHGIPDARPLEDGDIVNIDISVFYKGFHGDLNETFCVGTVDQKYKDLIKCTHDALHLAIAHVKPHTLVRDFGPIITKHVKKSGYSVVKAYCGHGIGALFHSSPSVPHYDKNKAIGVLKPGMVLTIEPMINMGGWRDKTWTFDNWTSVTEDGQRSAQFEHTLLVTDTGCEILTARTKNSRPMWWEENANSNQLQDTKQA